jgi:ATP cone domain
MTESHHLPSWVVDRAGRRSAFDGDVIFRALFRTADRLADADPFRTRELTDAVLHFLGESDQAETIATESIRDTVIKVVRELGHPALAEAYARLRDDSADPDRISNDGAADPDEWAAPAIRAESSRASAYPPEIVAAERRGLLTLWDHDAPLELAGMVLEPRSPAACPGGTGMTEALEAAREIVGQYVAIDSPDHLLAAARTDRDGIRAWARELRTGLRLTGLRAAVNLNCATPPVWGAPLTGPLFRPGASDHGARLCADAADALLEELLTPDPGAIRIDWHLSEWDTDPPQRERLLRVARLALEGAPIAFVPDRPRRPIALAEGLDRDQSAVLSVVGLRLDGLAAHLAQAGTVAMDLQSYCARLPGLVSLAISAGRARVRFLRRAARSSLAPGFRLDRARLMLVPTGLHDAVRAVTGSVADAAESVRTIVLALLGALARTPAASLSVILDSVPLGGITPIGQKEDPPAPRTMAPPRLQIRQAAARQSDAGSGTAYIQLPPDQLPDPSELADLIEFGYQNAGLVRFQFTRPKAVACVNPATSGM